MSEKVIRIENLGKKYLIRHEAQRQSYKSLRETLAAGAKALTRRLGYNSVVASPSFEDFWALKDVSFEVERGDVVGVIGRNGAGKSTLLKIVSQITEPTTGRVEIDGRVASLLEVGTGFHPELTGRENIFLNGAILGMSRREISEKFDEIVAFAEVEQFLDTPVKRYSSGMYMRLAFAVAAHLEPEILVVDEVLAVGDIGFQKKCLGKIGSVAKGGRTVLFVSHNMNAVEERCNRAIRLESGTMVNSSRDVRSVVVEYISNAGSLSANGWRNGGSEHANQWFKPLQFYVGDDEGRPAPMPARNDDKLFVYVEGEVCQPAPELKVGYALYGVDGELLYWSLSTDTPDTQWPLIEPGICSLRSQIPCRLLNEGEYRIELNLSLHFRDWLCAPGANAPMIFLSIQGGLSDSPYWMARRPGLLAPVLPWQRVS